MRVVPWPKFVVVGIALLAGAWSHPAIAQDAAPIVIPHDSWPTAMPEGIPIPESGTLIFEAEITLDQHLDVGRTPYGQRRVAVGGDGVVSGPRLSGTVMPGSLNFELTLSNGAVEVEQILVLQASDGSYIYSRSAGTGPESGDVRIALDFEAPSGSSWEWLHAGRFVGRRVVDPAAGIITIVAYDVSDVATPSDGADTVRIEKPEAVPHQNWDYRVADASETPGDELIVETVTLAPSQSVGPSKHGVRNVIPITGGTLTGQISGTVLFGGADYQNLSVPATIDARYLWKTDDGEIIIVRNGGTFGGLAPTFETRTDGPYAWLNTGSYLSASPIGAPGGVGITMYESKH